MKIFNLLLLLFILSFSYQTSASTKEKNTVPYTNLTGYTLKYYFSVFYYIMDNVKAGESFHWDTGTVKGDTRVGKKYLSKSKYICRDFVETFVENSIHKIDEWGKYEGAACKRKGSEGWCRLKHTNAHTCALEKPDSATDIIIRDTEDALGTGNGFLSKVGDWWGR